MSLSEQGAPTGRSTLFLYVWLWQQQENGKKLEYSARMLQK